MAKGKLRVATCQFPVGPRPARNLDYVTKLLREARRRRADIVHFPECALSGYAGVDHASLADFDWSAQHAAAEAVAAQAAQLKLYVVMGGAHRLSGRRRPHNSLYLIGPDGVLRDRYDKRFLMPRDEDHYTPGDHWVTFEINGVRCGLLICFDLRFPELYRALLRQGVRCVLQSFYNARQSAPSVHTHIMRQTMQGHAASNAMWMSMSNSCARLAPYPSCFIGPDGAIRTQMAAHRPGMIINTVDLAERYYDPIGNLRRKALRGALSSGPGVKDVRSQRRRQW